MNPVLAIALHEFSDALRNRWVLAAALCLGGLSLVLALVGTAPTGALNASALAISVANLSSLSVYLLPLVALLLSFDAIVGESERGTLALLLTYPLARWQVIAGKFAGQVAVLGLAVLIGYGTTGAFIVWRGESADGWQAYAVMMAMSVLLGAVFLTIGVVISTLTRERGTAVGMAVGVWLAFVVLYDFALLGWLMLDESQSMTPAALVSLLVANPTDAYRLLTLASVDAVASVTGMTGLVADAGLSDAVLLSALMAWVVVPLVIAVGVFHRREI